MRLFKHQCLRKKLSSLRWEIALALIVKLVLLFLIWDLFFSAPQAKHMKVPESQVTQHLLSPASQPEKDFNDR